jgi:hypothetical protein
MGHEERRENLRLQFSWPIWVLQNEEEVARGRTANISRRGAYFRSAARAALKPGMTVAVKIGVPTSEGTSSPLHTIGGKARVVRLEEEDEGCGVALHFSEDLDPFAEAKPGGSH